MPPMVNHNQMEATMFTKTIRRTVTIAAVLMAVPASALALPPGNGGPTGTQDAPPIARFTISPNPAIVSSQIVVKHARTAGFPGEATALQSGDLDNFDASTTTADDAVDTYSWDLGT